MPSFQRQHKGVTEARKRKKEKASAKTKKESRSIKRTFKDSVFCDLFSHTKYTIGLYRELHPEDDSATEADIAIVTLDNVIVDAPYNDVGFTVGDRVMVLVEAQSTRTPNIALRGLICYVLTLSDWLRDHGIDLYRGAAARIPKVELYVVYAGVDATPGEVVLSRDFPGLAGNAVDARVKVLRGGGTGTLSEYVEFCHVGDECGKEHGMTRKAASATVDECLRRGIPVEYLTERRKEVEDMLTTLFDQQEAMRIHDISVRRETAEETRASDMLEFAEGMIAGGEDLGKVARYSGLPIDVIDVIAGRVGEGSSRATSHTST